MKKLFKLLFILPIIISCSTKQPENTIVKIGKDFISKSQYEAFEKINKMYPTDPGNYFPVFRSRITHLVETELLYNKTPSSLRDSLKNSDDWKLKKNYYPAQMFLMDFLGSSLGIPDADIAKYYNTHKDSFKVTVTNDSTKTDSSYYRSLNEVKGKIVETLFLESNEPDTSFLARFDSLADNQYIDAQWISYVRKNLPSFFMKKIYKEMNGKPYPKNPLNELFGDDKYITQADFDVIINWVPESRRNLYEKLERKQELVEWLIRWKLFSAYAETHQLLDKQTVKNVMDWAWKLNVVYAYMNTVVAPAAESSAVVDSTMLLYELYDNNGYVPVKMTDNAFTTKLLSEKRNQTLKNIEKRIMELRDEVPIIFFQNDWIDVKNQKPDSLFKQAEIFRDSGDINKAKGIFLTLTKEFSSTPEGLNAYSELAKLQTEQQLYTQAIRNYRHYLINGGNSEKRCNTFFMIGFIYDEYLNKPLHAEFNYKWVLKNTPDCELSDDAEFMMLHLSEPMSSVEELRDEALRQGREVEESAEADTLKTAS